MAAAVLAWRQKQYQLATFKMVECLAHCKASLQIFQKLIQLDDNRAMFNDVINKFTDTNSVDHHLLVMVMTSAHPETPGIENRLVTMKQVMIGMYSTCNVLYTLDARENQHFGSPQMVDGRFLSRWKLLHYRAIFFSRLYAFRWAKKDSATAHRLMVSCHESDQEVESDFQHYATYSKEKKYTCAVCGRLPTENLFACSKCKVLSYCGRECQKLHWKKGGHKQSCNFLMLIVSDT